MNTTIQILIASILASITPGFFVLLNEWRLRRIAEARLCMAKLSTAADELLLSGDVKVGELCHDHLCKLIFATEHQKCFNISWNPFFGAKKEVKEFKKALEIELKSKSKMRDLLQQFAPNFAKAFRNTHPIKFFLFSIWVAVFCGGFIIVLPSLKLTITGLQGLIALHDGWCKLKSEIIKLSVVYGFNQRQCF